MDVKRCGFNLSKDDYLRGPRLRSFFSLDLVQTGPRPITLTHVLIGFIRFAIGLRNNFAFYFHQMNSSTSLMVVLFDISANHFVIRKNFAQRREKYRNIFKRLKALFEKMRQMHI